MTDSAPGCASKWVSGRVIERPGLAVSFAEINDLMGLGTIREMERRFLTAQQLEAKYGAKP